MTATDKEGPRLVFMGTPDVAVPVMESVIATGCVPVGVFTQPDRPSGRGLAEAAPAVKRFAAKEGLPVFQPPSLRTEEAQRTLASLAPDLIVVAAYGKLLPPAVLELPRRGCLNVHPSLLPKYRGPSPVVSAILGGDAVTGVTLMVLDEGMDSGPIVAQRQSAIGPEETGGGLTRRLFRMGGELLKEVLLPWCHGELRATAQDHSRATVTRKVQKSDGEARWDLTAGQLALQVRAFDPWPGFFTRWRGRILKVTEARVAPGEGEGPAGSVVALPDRHGGVGVVTGSGILELHKVQLEGRREVGVQEFVRGQRDFLGSRLPS